MANPSVTFTFANGTTADATQVNTNFTDLINSLTDGTKSLTIDVLTVGGTATLNGSVTLGNGTPDDISILGSLAASVPIKTTNTYDIGSATLGLAGVYLGAAGSFTTRLIGSATSSYTLTFPATSGTDGYRMETNGSGTLTFAKHGQHDRSIENIGLVNSTTSETDDSITITSADGTALSASNPGWVTLPGTTAGTLTRFKVTADVEIDLTGAHWGLGGGGDLTDQQLSVYALNNDGSLVWGVAYDSGQIVWLDANDSTTQTSITAFNQILVNSSLSADAQAHEIGWFLADFDDTGGASEDLWVVQSGDGEINMGPAPLAASEISVNTGAGHGSTNDRIRIFSTVKYNVGAAATYATSAADGASVTINQTGKYSITYSDHDAGLTTRWMGISLNSTELTTDINNIAVADILAAQITPGRNACLTLSKHLKAGDVLRPHDDSLLDGVDLSDYFIVALENRY